MNITSKEIRKQLRVFSTWFKSVGKGALLRDREFTPPTPEQFKHHIKFAVQKIGASFSEYEFDCDDFSLLTCALVILHRRKKSMRDGKKRAAYPIFPCALKENHTIVICITTEGIWFAEPQTGKCWSIKDEKPNVIFVG